MQRSGGQIFSNQQFGMSFHETSNDNGVRVVNFTISKNPVVKSTLFSCCKIYKYTWTSPDGKTHNHNDHVLTDRRQQSSTPDKKSDCNTEHY
jgi:hypothetical protein